MAPPPAISVLIAVRNGDRFIHGTLASLAAQSFRDFEIILVDNGSSDGTADIVRGWTRQEPRLRAFRQARPGLARTLNYAASQANAPLLARLDADDVSLPHRFTVQYNRLAKEPKLAVVGSYVDVISNSGRRLGTIRHPTDDGALRRELRTGCPLVHSTVMMRRSAFERAGGYRDGLRISEDFDLWCRMAELGEFANIPRVLVHYRLHADSISARQPVRMAIAATCVVAARRAREQGCPEPFREGSPCLRSAQTLLGIPRSDLLQQLRIALLRQSVDRSYLLVPLPEAVKGAIRRSAVRLGLKPLYNSGLQLLSRRGRRASAARLG